MARHSRQPSDVEGSAAGGVAAYCERAAGRRPIAGFARRNHHVVEVGGDPLEAFSWRIT